MVFLATSPGPRGAATVLATAVVSAPFFGADLKASLSVPSFGENFDVSRGIMTNDVLNEQLLATVNALVV